MPLHVCVSESPLGPLLHVASFYCTQGPAPGASKLAQKLIGPWTKASKAAKQDYENFVKAVVACLGGEPSSAEVQEACASVWTSLESAPAPEKLRQSRLSISGAVKPYRYMRI